MGAIISLENIITIIIGFVLGFLTNLFFFKRQMKNITILHHIEGPIDIGSGLTSLFPNVQLMYNETKIDFKIQYITGTIKNTDEKKTVTTLNLPFELKLPENCEVLEAKILEAPNDEILPKKKKNTVEISMPNTFLPQERIKYCILYKSPDKVESKINLNTRIANVDVVSTESDISFYDKVISLGISFLGGLASILFFMNFIYTNHYTDLVLASIFEKTIHIFTYILAISVMLVTLLYLRHTKH